METLSPELALVDETLARAARDLVTPRDVFADLARTRAAEPLRLLRERLAVTADLQPPPRAAASSRLREAGSLALVAVLAAGAWTAVTFVTRSDSAPSGGAPPALRLPEASPPPVTIGATLHMPAATVTSPRPRSRAANPDAAKPAAPPTVTARAGAPPPASPGLPER